jgi:hypothetical protein
MKYFGLQRDPALRFGRERIAGGAAAVAQQGGVGDHGGVVAGVDERHQAELDALPVGPGGQLAPQQAVGGGAAGDGEQRHRPALLEAAEARCTVGEIMAALADVFGRYDGAAKW